MSKLFAIFKDAEGKTHAEFYDSYEWYHRDAFNPLWEEMFLLDLTRICGKTYKEKAAFVRNKAIEWSNQWSECPGLSYGELWEIDHFFEKYGKRYGLLREFRENAIC